MSCGNELAVTGRRAFGGLTYSWRADVERGLRGAPVARAILGTMIAAAALAGVLALAGLLIALLGSVRDGGSNSTSSPRALSPREVRAELRLRIALAAALGVLAGLAIAVVLTVLALAAVRAGARRRRPPTAADHGRAVARDVWGWRPRRARRRSVAACGIGGACSGTGATLGSRAMRAVALRNVFCVHRTSEGDAAALQGTTLTVARGEIVCVLGPSGAGKSTLLRVIAGLQTPSAGEVSVLGEEVGRCAVTGARAAAPGMHRLPLAELGRGPVARSLDR